MGDDLVSIWRSDLSAVVRSCGVARRHKAVNNGPNRLAREFVSSYGVPVGGLEAVGRATVFPQMVAAAAHDCACGGLCAGAWRGAGELGGGARRGPDGRRAGYRHLP